MPYTIINQKVSPGSQMYISKPISNVATPTLVSAIVATNGTTLTLSFSETVNCSSSAGLTFNDGTTYSLTYTGGSGGTVLTFTIGTTVYNTDVCLLSYSQGSGNIKASGAGNAPLASFTNVSVTNDSTLSAPMVTSATVQSNGTTFTLVFSEAVVCTNANGLGFSDGGSQTITYLNGTGTTTINFTITTTTVQYNDTCTMSYTHPPGNIVSVVGSVPLQSIASVVTNHSGQGFVATMPSLKLWYDASSTSPQTNGAVLLSGSDCLYTTSATQSLIPVGGGTSSTVTYALWMQNLSTTITTFTVFQLTCGAHNVNLQFTVQSGSTTFIPKFQVGTNSATWGSALNNSTWYFIQCGINSNGYPFISVNNANAVVSGTQAASPGAITQFCIGTTTQGTNPLMHGYIDSFGIWNKASQTGEGAALYNSGNGLTYSNLSSTLSSLTTNLVSWYDFNTLTADRKGSNNLTSSGSPQQIQGLCVGPALNGDTVQSLVDLSSNANNATNPNFPSATTYATNQINGLSVCQQQQSDFGFTLGSTITLSSAPFTIYFVGSVITNTGDGFGTIADINTNLLSLGGYQNPNFAILNNGTPTTVAYTPSSGNVAWRIRFDSSGHCHFQGTGMSNEVTVTSSNFFGGGYPTLDTVFDVGDYGGGHDTNNIGEMVVCLADVKTSNAAKDTAMINYLNYKWGVTV